MVESTRNLLALSQLPAQGSTVNSQVPSSSLDAGDQHVLEAVARSPKVHPAGAVLVREGAAMDRLLVVKDGWACRYKMTRSGRRQIVALLMPGDVINLNTLMFSRPSASVLSLTVVKTVAVTCDDALLLIGSNPSIGLDLIQRALQDNAVLSQWALRLGRLSARQRLAHLLCEVGERLLPDCTKNGLTFHLPLTQAQLADALGLTSVHINRTFQQLRSDGLVETSNRTISFPDVSRLRNFANFDAGYLNERPADRRWHRDTRS